LAFAFFHLSAWKFPFVGQVGVFVGAALYAKNFLVVDDDGGEYLDFFH
jgi:hypothetical protein